MFLISGTLSGRRIRVQMQLLSLGIVLVRLSRQVFSNRVEIGKGSDLEISACRNVMLLGNMNIFRPMTHAQQGDGDNFKEHAKENKKSRTGNYDYSQHKSGGGNRSHGQQKFSAPTPSSASVPYSKKMYDQKGRAPVSKF